MERWCDGTAGFESCRALTTRADLVDGTIARGQVVVVTRSEDECGTERGAGSVKGRLDKLLPNVGERLPQEVVRVEEAATAVLLMFARVAVAQVGMVG